MAVLSNTLEKAAAILMCLGESTAREVLACLPPEAAQQLSTLSMNPSLVTQEFREQMLRELQTRYARLSSNGRLSLESVEETGSAARRGKASAPFSDIYNVEVFRLQEILSNEPPSIISLVLYYLPRDKSAQVMAGLAVDVRHEVVMRLVNLQMPMPQVVARLEHLLLQKLSDTPEGEEAEERDLTAIAGARTLVEILGHVNPVVEREVYEFLQERDPALAEEVRKQMFVFEDIGKLEGRALQIVLREMTSQDLALALKGASEELRELVFGNVSANFSKAITEELELLGPVRITLVEEAQQKVAATVRRLVEEGTITLSRSDEAETLI